MKYIVVTYSEQSSNGGLIIPKVEKFLTDEIKEFVQYDYGENGHEKMHEIYNLTNGVTLFMKDTTWAQVIFKDEKKNDTKSKDYIAYRFSASTAKKNFSEIPFRIITF